MAERGDCGTRWGLSNSADCLRALAGKRIVGFLEGALPVNRADLARGTKTLVFEDGTGFTFKEGAFWHESRDDVMRALDCVARRMADAMATFASVQEMAGVKNNDGPPCANYTARAWSPTSPVPEDARCVNCGHTEAAHATGPSDG